MRCANQIGTYQWCLAEIDPDSQYVVTEDQKPLCESCVDTKILFAPIADERDTLGRFNVGSKGRKSVGDVKTVAV